MYNALTMHAIAHMQKDIDQDTSILAKCSKFWTQKAYRISEFVFSLDDIEHGILRGS